jgi:uncharacterized membrane protein
VEIGFAMRGLVVYPAVLALSKPCKRWIGGLPTPRMDPLTRLVHVLALAVYLGATIALAVIFLPAVMAIDDPVLQRRVAAKGLRPYNVLTFGALLAALATGWSSITDLKASLGPAFGQLIWLLAGKLGLTFLLIVLPASYLSFGLAHRLVRAEVGDLPVEPDKQRAILARMRGAAWLAVALTIWITWMGLRLTHTLSSQPPPVAHVSP